MRQNQSEIAFPLVFFAKDRVVVVKLVIFFHQVIAVIGNSAWAVVVGGLPDYCREA